MTEIDLVERSLALLRAELSPSSADKVRLRKRVGLPPRVPEAAASKRERPQPSRWAAVRASGRLGAALGAAAFGAGLSVGLCLQGAPKALEHTDRALDVQPRSEPPALPPAPPLPQAQVPSIDPEQQSEAAPRAPRVKAHPHARATASVPPPPGADRAQPLETELTLLRRVERALRTQDPALALALLGELDQRFPQTKLVEERLAARRIAECRLGSDGAEDNARSFAKEYPASVYLERIATACRKATPSSEPRE